jgi:cell division protein FtsB
MKKKSITKIIYLLIILILAVILFVNKNGVLKYLKLKSNLKKLDNRIEEIDIRIKKLNLEIDSLKTSDVKIEKVARDKYRMKLENETPIKIDKK